MRIAAICLTFMLLTGCVSWGSASWFERRQQSLAAQASFDLDCKAAEVRFEPADGEDWSSVIGRCGNRSALYKRRVATSGRHLVEGDWERHSEVKVAAD